MKIRVAMMILSGEIKFDYYKDRQIKNERDAKNVAIKSLEVLQNLENEVKELPAGVLRNNVYVERQALIKLIEKHISEVENEIQAGDGGCQGPDQRDTGSVQG